MPLAAGARLGPYEIQAPLGSGGMGEVYRARDTRLGRPVAVKVLPADRSSSEEARARLDREAKAISRLSHPNICTLFDVGRDGGTDYLVMELLEGETLAQRLARGRLPIAETVRHAREIADALDRAHRAGVVHRDLKPANVFLTSSGVKLLDFGLARAAPGAPTVAWTSTLETVQRDADLSAEGLVVGTLSYMAPEQVEGRPADARADLFALGAVLHEMLTGRRPFDAATPAGVAAAILRDEPRPVRELRPECPAALDRLVAACLVKDREERWQSAHDVAVALETAGEAGAGAEPAAPARPRPRWVSLAPWGVAAVATAFALVALVRPRPPAPPVPPVRFSLPLPPGSALPDQIESLPVAVSPDGSELALIVREPGGRQRVWLRKLSALDAQPLDGTDDAVSAFWSPDGRSLAFVANAKLDRLDLGSNVVQPLCDVREAIGLHGTWSATGQILFATVEGQEISRVSASGGTPVEVVKSEAPPGPARVQWPSFLPDGRRFLYLARYTDGRSRLLLGEEGTPPRDVGSAESVAQYVDPGVLVFAREGTLFGQRFDLAGGSLSGEPFAIAQPVRQFTPTGWAMYSVSRNGVLVYGSQRDVSRLTWFDRAGAVTKLDAEADALSGHGLRLSADGQRALFSRYDPKTAQDLWVLDVAHGLQTRLVSGPSADVFPVWLPGGRSIVYSSVRGHPPQLMLRDLASGAERELTPPPRGLQEGLDVTPDGRTLVLAERTPSGAFSLFTLPLPGGGTPAPLLQTPFSEEYLRLSPDGRLAAFTSNESGDDEVYLARFPALADKVRVSRAGGTFPRWRADGRELFYLAPDGALVSVPVRPGTTEFGEARTLFRIGGRLWAGFDVTPDGQRFLAVVPEVLGSEQPLTVALDAVAEALRGR